MIRELFAADRAVFVRFDQDGFCVGPRRREYLQGLINDMRPVRKRFEHKHLVCWSNDGITGRNGERCTLCRDFWNCVQRVRLMLLLDGLAKEPLPAILEIGHGSFDALDQFVQSIGKEQLVTTSVCIRMERCQGHLRFSFQKAT